MQALRRSTPAMAAVFFGLFFMTVLSVDAASGVYTNRGEISGISLTHDTVVVEVPVKGQLMTVGGALVDDAELKMGNRTAALEDFVVGETVTVKWQYTEQGHRILGLYK